MWNRKGYSDECEWWNEWLRVGQHETLNMEMRNGKQGNVGWNLGNERLVIEQVEFCSGMGNGAMQDENNERRDG